MSRPPFNLELVENGTRAALDRGERILQTHRYDDSDIEHVAILLDWLRPRAEAMVLDAGCGVGEVSRWMALMRPDLSFALVNVSPFQFSYCPMGPQFTHVLADFHELPLDDGSVDAVMFSSALCQMDTGVALGQAFRVLRPGGVLLINDMVRSGGDAERMERLLAARVLPASELLYEVRGAGFIVEKFREPAYVDSFFVQEMEATGFGDLLNGVHPILIRATKPC